MEPAGADRASAQVRGVRRDGRAHRTVRPGPREHARARRTARRTRPRSRPLRRPGPRAPRAAARRPVTETYAVALVGDPVGWLVAAASADEAIDIVHGTVRRAADCARDELVARTEREYRDRYLPDAPMPATWSRL